MQKIIDYCKTHAKLIGLIVIIVIVIVVLITACSKKVELTCDDAEKIILDKIQTGSIIKCELKHRNYEIEVLYQGLEYEFIVDANSGEIKEYDADEFD